MGNGDSSSRSFLSDDEADKRTKDDQKKRLEQAKAVMADYNVSEAKSLKKGRAIIKTAIKGSAKRENTATEQLKRVSETPEEKVERYQDNPCEVKELTQRIRALYGDVRKKRPSRTKYLNGRIEMEFFEYSSGWMVLNGDVFGCGGNHKRRDELESLMDRVADKREEREHDGSEESVIEHIEGTTEAWQDCVDACDEKDLENFWTEASLAGQEGKRKWKRDSIKAIRMKVAMRGNQCPSLPMTMQQYNALRYAYSHDIFRNVKWKTPLDKKEREDAANQLEQQYGIGVSSVTKLMLEDHMSKSTVQKTVNYLQGKGMTTQEEMELIRRLSMLLVMG